MQVIGQLPVPVALSPGTERPVLIGGWADPRIGLDMILLPFRRESNLGSSTVRLVAYCTDLAINKIIQLNSLLFMCRVNNQKANYRHSTV
jgi:hypothetical protein